MDSTGKVVVVTGGFSTLGSAVLAATGAVGSDVASVVLVGGVAGSSRRRRGQRRARAGEPSTSIPMPAAQYWKIARADVCEASCVPNTRAWTAAVTV